MVKNIKDEIDASWDLIGYCLRKMYELDTESPSEYYKEMAIQQMDRLSDLLRELKP
jgi:hypothetical protein